MGNIALRIGGFNIVVNFAETESFILKRQLIHSLSKRYNEFLLRKNSGRVDYTITLIDVKDMRSLNSPEGDHFFINLYDQTKKDLITTFYHISLLQFDTILTHVIQDLLARNNGLIMHTSATLIQGKAFCFMGRSGVGKSTVAKLLEEKYKPLADDVGIIRKEDGQYFFYQMPLFDKNKKIRKSSKPIPLGAIYFLHKKLCFLVNKIKDKEKIIKYLCLQLYSEKKDVSKQIVLLSEFVNSNDIFFDLYFSKKKEEMIKLFSKQ